MKKELIPPFIKTILPFIKKVLSPFFDGTFPLFCHPLIKMRFKKHYNIAHQSLNRVFPKDLTQKRLNLIYYNSIRLRLKNLLIISSLNYFLKKYTAIEIIIDPQSQKLIDNPQEAIITVSPHFGLWSLIVKKEISSLIFKNRELIILNKEKTLLHEMNDIEIKPLIASNKFSARIILNHLKQKNGTVFFIDNSSRNYSTGQNIMFLDKKAYLHPAPFKIAQKTNSQILPTFIFAVPQKNKYILKVAPPIQTQNKSIEKIMTETYQCLSEVIKQNPCQWQWFYDTWR